MGRVTAKKERALLWALSAEEDDDEVVIVQAVEAAEEGELCEICGEVVTGSKPGWLLVVVIGGDGEVPAVFGCAHSCCLGRSNVR